MENLTWDTPMTIQALEVREGDFVLGKPVMHIIELNDWMLQLFWEDSKTDQGYAIDISKMMLIPVVRTLPLADDQCVVCGSRDKRIIAKHMDGGCYQKSRSKKPADSSKDSSDDLVIL